ncbi:MAG: transglycosylase domain-containing protein [Caulobacteraceae bacterium]|nr:transglycosylase domain-containing protein [Caulobacteraceae bacterium]
MIGEPPDRPEGHDPDDLGPATFRADLLHQQQARFTKAGRLLIAAGVGLFLLLLVGGFNLWRYFLADLPTVPSMAQLTSLKRAPGMTFLDRNGALIATRGPKYGLKVSLDRLPPYVPRAFLAAEDRRFYEHGAVDWRAVIRALRSNVGAGRTVEGASTITQQLTRDLFLGPERTLKRKVQEILLSGDVYRRLGRRGVLELYLNRVYLGENAYGVDAAARTYFGKPATALSLAEAAVLAGLPQAPSQLDPTENAAAALARGRVVLRRMLAEGWITPAQAAAAARQPVVLVNPRPEGDFGWVLDMAAAEAREVAPGDADLVVRLTVDPALQLAAAKALRETLDGEGRRLGARQGAVVVLGLDGAVRALVGGRDRSTAFNRATQAVRQPGSAFKPFVWAAALEAGVDADESVSTRPAGLTEAADTAALQGELSLTEALARSDNNVARRLAAEAGYQRVSELARRFGLPENRGAPLHPQPSIALGAYGATLIDLTAAYQPFQQGGKRRLHRGTNVRGWYLVEEVLGSDGRVIWPQLRRQPDTLVVFDSARSGAMVKMLQAVVDHGTGRRAAFGGPAAGKTGTSQKNRDAWFVGFTPDWLAGVWIGNDDEAPMRGVEGGSLPAEVWRRVILAAQGELPARDFEASEGETAPEAPAGDSLAAGDRAAFYRTLSSEFDRIARQ